MPDFHSSITKHTDVNPDVVARMNAPVTGAMDEEHTKFLARIIKLLDEKKIDVSVPTSFLNADVYAQLGEAEQRQIDVALPNIADQVRLIEGFFRDTKTPNACPQLQTMIEHLWQMTRRLEERYDVLKI
jgi:hypothetical protein